MHKCGCENRYSGPGNVIKSHYNNKSQRSWAMAFKCECKKVGIGIQYSFALRPFRAQEIVIQVPFCACSVCRQHQPMFSSPTKRPRKSRYCPWRRKHHKCSRWHRCHWCCCSVAVIVDFPMEAKGKCVRFFFAPHLKYTDSQPVLCSFVLLRSLCSSCISRRNKSGTADFGAYSDDDTNYVNYTLPLRMHAHNLWYPATD